MLESGRQLLHYRLVEKIGAGGMGVVWRAVDTTLDREVAIKVLPDVFSQDTERLARFEREAKALARLNHPNIASIHSLHEAPSKVSAQPGVRFLSMELVAGEDLSERIARGPVPVNEALAITIGIASALEAAHAAGIVHRDLKPANVKLSADGGVKVLDFGLAKAWASDPVSDQPDPALSPTMTSAGTVVGMILGTASYMSPEQARGKVVDQRTDIWALGVILFELLTGRQLFSGEDVSEILAGVIKGDLAWNALPAELPRSARLALGRCLERNPHDRLHSAADLRILIEEGRRETADPVEPRGSIGPSPSKLPWALLGTTVIVAAVGLWWLARDAGTAPAPASVRFTIEGSEEMNFRRTVSPSPFFDVTADGQTIVFGAVDREGERQLYARNLDSLEARPLPGTEDASEPFLSSSGMLAFAARSQLRATFLGGLASFKICDIADGFSGASYAPDGSVIFADDFDTGLKRVRERGEPVEELTAPDRASGEKSHSLPYVLPNGRGVVFTVTRLATSEHPEGVSTTAVLDLDSGSISTVMEGTQGPYRYVLDKYLLMLRAGRMVVLPFDDVALERSGVPFPAFGDEAIPMQAFAISPQGTLVHSDVTWIESSGLVWIDRDGTETPITEDKGNYRYPALGPDTKRVAVTRDDQTWIYELDEGRRTRLTQNGASYVPLFSPDGSRVVFGGYLPDENLYWMPSDGSTEPQLLLAAENRQYPLDWHAATDTLILQWTDPESGYDIRALPADGSGPAEPLLDSRHNERWAQLSPDGRWLAYASDESGRYEIYIVSYPDGRGKRAVSSDGGIEPRWSPRGDEIFYILGGAGELFRPSTRLVAVPVTSGERLEIGTPTLLFEGSYPSGACCGFDYDVAPDGQRFVMVKARPDVKRSVTVELNAFDRILGSGKFDP